LRSRQLLLILDNCEHVAAGCAELSETLLRACPRLHILATSRQPLQTDNERLWRVQPLVAGEAVSLFAARAALRAPEFRLTESTLGVVTDICRRLDGLPLAIELVAARTDSFDLADIAARIETGLRLSVTGPRTAPARQQTLRATLDWSYSMLAHNEAVLLRRLAVFAGGWTLEAAHAVCADAVLSVTSIAELLERLVAKSLVMLDRNAAGERYRLLETVREYALERLETSIEATHIRRRHAAHVLELVERVPPEAVSAAHGAILEREQGDVRAALAWAVNQPEVELGLRLARGAYDLWSLRGHYAEGRAWLERALRLPEADSTPWGIRVRAILGQILIQQGEYAAAEAASQAALEGSTAAGDELGVALATRSLGNVALWRGNLTLAGALLGEAVGRLRVMGSHGQFSALVNYATVALERDEVEQVLELAADFEQRGQAWQGPLALARGLFLRGSVAARSGDAALAEELFRRAFELQEPLAYHQFRVVLLTELGHTLLDQAKVGQAKIAFAEALRGASDAGLRIRVARALDGVARSMADSQPSDAVRLAGAAAGLRTLLGVIAWPRELRHTAAWLPAVRRELGERAYAAAWMPGETLMTDEATDLARALLDTPAQNLSPLTRRQTEVAALLARGLSTSEVAAELVISMATVRVHVDHILAKLDLHSRTQIAVWVREHAEATAPSVFPGRD
jgi:predicted ATPase/DNA-binding CsgD family transcriptional regulator